MKSKRVEIPIYFGSLVMYKSNKWKKIEKKYNLDSTQGFLAFAFSVQQKNRASQYVVCLPKKCDASVLAHEALHITNLILKERGVYVSLEEDEAQAYLLGWVIKELNKFLK